MRWVKQVARLSVRGSAAAAGKDKPARGAEKGQAGIERAIAEMRKRGGRVETDEKTLGQSVVKVNLSATKATDADLVAIGQFPQLEDLSLAGTQITDSVVAALADAARPPAVIPPGAPSLPAGGEPGASAEERERENRETSREKGELLPRAAAPLVMTRILCGL